jgi:hypothetical protein
MGTSVSVALNNHIQDYINFLLICDIQVLQLSRLLYNLFFFFDAYSLTNIIYLDGPLTPPQNALFTCPIGDWRSFCLLNISKPFCPNSNPSSTTSLLKSFHLFAFFIMDIFPLLFPAHNALFTCL